VPQVVEALPSQTRPHEAALQGTRDVGGVERPADRGGEDQAMFLQHLPGPGSLLLLLAAVPLECDFGCYREC
jgi:hypothetical protein